jgi:hypothetical protein
MQTEFPAAFSMRVGMKASQLGDGGSFDMNRLAEASEAP